MVSVIYCNAKVFMEAVDAAIFDEKVFASGDAF
jgi:hypothetical protein